MNDLSGFIRFGPVFVKQSLQKTFIYVTSTPLEQIERPVPGFVIIFVNASQNRSLE